MRWGNYGKTIDTIDPLFSALQSESPAYAKTLRRDGKTWGGIVPTTAKAPENKPDYSEERRVTLSRTINSAMDCQICHTSWGDELFRLSFCR